MSRLQRPLAAYLRFGLTLEGSPVPTDSGEALGRQSQVADVAP
jgi:hypothetical protein